MRPYLYLEIMISGCTVSMFHCSFFIKWGEYHVARGARGMKLMGYMAVDQLCDCSRIS
jgi:hypothetical protein